MSDVIGLRDLKADPVVKATVYGGPRDLVVRIVDTAVGVGMFQREIVQRDVKPANIVPIPLDAHEVFERRWREREAREART